MIAIVIGFCRSRCRLMPWAVIAFSSAVYFLISIHRAARAVQIMKLGRLYFGRLSPFITMKCDTDFVAEAVMRADEAISALSVRHYRTMPTLGASPGSAACSPTNGIIYSCWSLKKPLFRFAWSIMPSGAVGREVTTVTISCRPSCALALASPTLTYDALGEAIMSFNEDGRASWEILPIIAISFGR